MQRPKTKIIATLGPASNSEEIIEQLIRSGMNIARLNFSHGTLDERRVSERLGEHIAILGDLPGPKMRTGETADPAGVEIASGSIVMLTYDPDAKTTNETITTSYPYLGEDVSIDDPILLDDGALILYVNEIVSRTEIKARVKTGGKLKSHKGINFPRTKLRIPALTDHDKELVLFAVNELGVDALALSFVRRAGDILQLKHYLKTVVGNEHIPIIAKIEKPEAVEHIETILGVADKIMVARGDLGVEMPLEQVPPVQKRIIDMANRIGVPVITATQMLESMIQHPRPTRAEASDVANAVFDGSDCIMLSGETSMGKYPVEAVSTMREIAMQAENSGYTRRDVDFHTPEDTFASATDSIAHAACMLAEEVGAHTIIAATLSGKSARYVAKYRFKGLVIGMSTSEVSLRRMAFYYGVIPLKLESVKSFDDTLTFMIDSVVEKGLMEREGFCVLTAGHPTFQVSSTNIVKVQHLG